MRSSVTRGHTEGLARCPALVLLLLTALGGACDRTPEAKPDALPKTAPQREPARPSTTEFKRPGSARVVAIGDIHGDLSALRATLRLAGAIDSDDHWIGKGLTVVQTGDLLDRGDQDRQVLDEVEKLEHDAPAGGGRFYALNGNHELMNAGLDFRYVSEKGFAGFDDYAARSGALAPRLPAAERGRAAALAPGGPYALTLSRRPVIAMVGDSLFAHGGVLPEHVDYGLDRINAEASAFLAGKRAQLPAVLAAENAPVWTRLYGKPEVDEQTCRLLGRVLSAVGAKRLVVGHTVEEGGISSACGERLFRIDVGLSAFYGHTVPQVLEITAAGTRVLRADAAKAPSQVTDSALHSAP